MSMTISLRAAVAALVALSTMHALNAQEPIQNSPVPNEESSSGVYVSLSDSDSIEDTDRTVAGEGGEAALAFDALSGSQPTAITANLDVAAPSVDWLADAKSNSVLSKVSVGVDDGGIGTSSSLGLANYSSSVACGCPEVPSCGIASPGASCGLSAGCSDCGHVPCGSLCTRQCPSCCGVGTHNTFVYGEVLYLRARNAEVAYAVPADGPIVAGQPTPIQIGNLGILDPDYEVGFRGGLNVALDTVSSLDIRYTLFESLTEDESEANAPNVLRSLVTHPSTATAAQDALSGHASLEVDFDTIDVSYRHLLKCSDICAVNYVLGARYAKLEQQFDVQFVKNGTEFVSTDIDFDGGGLRLGLETERYSCRNQLHVYANGYASFLAGRFRGSYFQGDSFDPEVVNAEWQAGRVVPILDLECGVGWTSVGGNLRLSAGYLVSAWFNTVTTQDLIDAIQRNDYLGLSETLTFDGLQARLEYRF